MLLFCCVAMEMLTASILGPACIPPWSCLFPPLVLPASLPGPAAAECHQAPPSGLPGGSPISANTGQNIIRDEKREREEGGTRGLFNLSLPVPRCSCRCPCLGAGEIHQASPRLGVASCRDSHGNENSWNCCVWREPNDGKS